MKNKRKNPIITRNKKSLHSQATVPANSYFKILFSPKMQDNLLISVFEKHLPQGTVSYCYKLWYENHFYFKLAPRRESKLGDYRYDPRTKKHTITLNHDLNPYSFLVTYLHEVAHLKAQIRYGNRIKPHGEQWKAIFSELLLPIFERHDFPESLSKALKNYIADPKASTCADTNLMMALREFDKDDNLVYLSEIPEGQRFRLGRKYFIKGKLNRTRYICKECKSGKSYYVSEIALVEV
jgi:SprT protein